MMLETLWNLFVRYPVVRIEQVGCPYEKTGNDRGTIECDYIVVGGGTAGCVIANRLSAHRDMKVLLLERGAIGASLLGGNVLLSFPGIGTVPAKEMKLAPQKNLNGKEMKMYEGLSLGGRSSINGSLYLQGCPEEYATWGKGWQWDDVAPLFARFERRLELEPRDNLDPDHEGGEWKTRYVEPQFRSSKEFEAALETMGVKNIGAYTDPATPTCFGLYNRRTVDGFGRRVSTHQAFLPKHVVRRRKNLTLCLGANVQRILFDNTTEKLTANAVLVEGEDNQLYIVRVRKEVILCAGAVVTPQLLLLSGVGPKDHLSEVGKPCVHDLAGVGSTLQDHFHVAVNFYIPLRDSIHILVSSPLTAILAILQFLLFGTGLLLTIVTEYFAYFHTRHLPPNHQRLCLEKPDLELFWSASFGAFDHPKFPRGKGAGCVMVQSCCPKSVGTVRLTRAGANDVKVDPIVDPNYFAEEEDFDIYRRGIVFARQIGMQMSRNGYPVEEIFPIEQETKEVLDEYVREHGLSGQHLLSSCRMKPLDEGGVVDQELKVHGIEGLRIADGSILPGMVASRPQATIAMIGERCADFIREGWKLDVVAGKAN